jgi:taurine dioxygenase
MLEARPLQPFGAEVDFDLSSPQSADVADQVRQLFFTHSLLLFRRQSLSMSDQMRLVAYVGPLLEPSAGYLSPEDGILDRRKLDFHSDLCSTPFPFDAISLHAQEVDEGRTSTKFASGRLAYRRLPQALKARLEGLQVNMVQTVADKTKLKYDVPADALNMIRPIILRHRVTGEPILFCSESSAARVEGLSKTESDALLGELFARLYCPDNIYEHVWRNGDLVVWDNLALQHARDAVPEGSPRRLQRVVAGLKTLREQVPSYDLTPVITEMHAVRSSS